MVVRMRTVITLLFVFCFRALAISGEKNAPSIGGPVSGGFEARDKVWFNN